MYHLFLTIEDRKAIDWIGSRYSHGWDLWNLITDGENFAKDGPQGNFTQDIEFDWSTDHLIRFDLPENLAWQVKELLDNSLLDCFSDPLVAKLRSFAESIV